jgi:transposase InsO family protein
VIAIRSNIRWCSDALKFTCWNGEIVRVAFVLDCHDREVIGWLATTAGISGEMIRDMMVQCVELRFGSIRAPHRVQWLTDNGSIFAAHKTIEIALALNLEPCFTPVESPESNGHGAKDLPLRIKATWRRMASQNKDEAGVATTAVRLSMAWSDGGMSGPSDGRSL